IILDEPFSGFDPVNAQIIQDEILELNRNGATIIYSTHRMETVEELCDNIALIDKAKKILDGSVIEIKKQYQSKTYLIDYNAKHTVINHSSSIYELIQSTTYVEYVQIKITINTDFQLNDVLNYLIPQAEI